MYMICEYLRENESGFCWKFPIKFISNDDCFLRIKNYFVLLPGDIKQFFAVEIHEALSTICFKLFFLPRTPRDTFVSIIKDLIQSSCSVGTREIKSPESGCHTFQSILLQFNSREFAKKWFPLLWVLIPFCANEGHLRHSQRPYKF